MIKIELKRSEKRAIRMGLLAVVLVIILNLVVFPFYDSRTELMGRKENLVQDLKTLVQRLGEAKDLDQQIERFRQQIERGNREAIAGQSEEMAQVALEELVTNLAREQGLQVTNSYKERSVEAEYGYRKVSARITVRGEYPSIVHLLDAIQNRPELIAATDLSLKHYRGYNATITVMGLAR